MNTDSFSWLHLTDFHYGLQGQRFLWPNLREPFFRDMITLHDKVGPWRAVLFTGDLVQSGTSLEFDAMQREVLDRLWQKLHALGSGDAILLAVPGNHDLCRPDPKADDAAVDTLLREAGFNEIADKFWTSADNSYHHVIDRAFSNYKKWWAATSRRPKSGLTDGILPGDFAYTVECGDRRIGIIGLNVPFFNSKKATQEWRVLFSFFAILALRI